MAEAGPSAKSGRRVLVAEDDALCRLVLVSMLDTLECEVVVACNGIEALAAADQGHYCLAFFDWRMPEMDGLTALRELRGRWRSRGQAGFPIVACTASVFPDEIATCWGAGVDDVLKKPFRIDELRALLARWCPAA